MPFCTLKPTTELPIVLGIPEILSRIRIQIPSNSAKFDDMEVDDKTLHEESPGAFSVEVVNNVQSSKSRLQVEIYEDWLIGKSEVTCYTGEGAIVWFQNFPHYLVQTIKASTLYIALALDNHFVHVLSTKTGRR